MRYVTAWSEDKMVELCEIAGNEDPCSYCPKQYRCPFDTNPRVISGTSHLEDSAMPDYDDPIYQG